MAESVELLAAKGIYLDTIRVKAFPFSKAVDEFAAAHEHVFVVEQNRDGQLRTLLMNENGISPAKLIPILHYDGTPITANFITSSIANQITLMNLNRKAG